MAYSIEIDQICKTYRGVGYEVKALRNVSMKINTGEMTAVVGTSGSGKTTLLNTGEMTAVVGTSGSGKTTLLNILGLIDSPDSGTYRLGDIDTGECTETERAGLRNSRLGFILQEFALIDRYTVEQNIKIPLLYSNVPKREWNMRIDAMLDKLGIAEKKKRRPAELSGGQKQRVAIARALISQGDVILADEPTGALDSRTSLEIIDLFQRIKSENKTIVLVTHDHDIAAECDRILHIEDGRLYED